MKGRRDAGSARRKGEGREEERCGERADGGGWEVGTVGGRGIGRRGGGGEEGGSGGSREGNGREERKDEVRRKEARGGRE